MWMDEVFNSVPDKNDKYHYEIVARIIQIQSDLSKNDTKYYEESIILAEKMRKAYTFTSEIEKSEDENNEDNENNEENKEEDEQKEEDQNNKKSKKQKIEYETDRDFIPKWTMDDEEC